jgi:uncharacterized protein
VRLHLFIQPRASVSEVIGLHDGRIKIRLAAPPVEGAANAALLKFLARRLGAKLSSLEILSGTATRRKTVLVQGFEMEQAALLLGVR